MRTGHRSLPLRDFSGLIRFASLSDFPMVPLMMKTHRLALFALALSLSAPFSGPAFAQSAGATQNDNSYLFNFGQQEEEEKAEPAFNPYDPKYRGAAARKAARDPRSVFSVYDLSPSLIRGPGGEEGFFTLRMSAPASVTGCLEKKDTRVDIARHGHALKIKMSGGEIKTDQYAVRYAHYTCDPVTAVASTDITFGRDQILKDGIREVTLLAGDDQILGTYLIAVDAHKAEIVSKARALVSKELEDSERILTWFYPDNTYVLYAPDVNAQDRETAGRLRALAEGKGLSPLESVLPGFKPTFKNRGKIYVVDTRGVYRGKAGAGSPAFDIGHIEDTEPYYAAGGPQDRPVKKIVMVRRPGLDE